MQLVCQTYNIFERNETWHLKVSWHYPETVTTNPVTCTRQPANHRRCLWRRPHSSRGQNSCCTAPHLHQVSQVTKVQNIQLGDIVRQLKLYWGFNNEGDIFSPPSKALPLSLTTETSIYLIAFSCVCAAQCTLNSKYCRKEVEAPQSKCIIA